MEFIDIEAPVHCVIDTPTGWRPVGWRLPVRLATAREENAPVVAKWSSHDYRAHDGRLWARRLPLGFKEQGAGMPASRLVLGNADATIEVFRDYPIQTRLGDLKRYSEIDRREDHDDSEEMAAAEERLRTAFEELLVVDDEIWMETKGPVFFGGPARNSPAKRFISQMLTHGYAAGARSERMGIFSAFDHDLVREAAVARFDNVTIGGFTPIVLSEDGWSRQALSRHHGEKAMDAVLESMVGASETVSFGLGGRELVMAVVAARSCIGFPLEESMGMAERFLRHWPKGCADPMRDRQWEFAMSTIARIDMSPSVGAEELDAFVL